VIDIKGMKPEQIEQALAHIATLPIHEQEELLAMLETLEGMNAVQNKKDHFLDFIKHVYPGYKVGEHHKKLAQIFEDIANGKKKRVIVNIAPRHGKQCAHSTPVLTTKGWTTHGELKVGDEVFHPSGRPVPVIALSEDSTAEYEVVTSSGDVIKCHANHEWTVVDRPNKKTKTVETKWFLENSKSGPTAGTPRKLMYGDKGKRGSRYHYQLPDVGTLQFDEQELNIDPYLLGVWLGDGKADAAQFCMSKEDMDEILPTLTQYRIQRRYIHATTQVHYVLFELAFRHDLKKLGVFNNKHIPKEYMYSSVSQRLELLAGLVDTDGHVELDTGRVRIVTCSAKLKDDILELAASLGFRPYVTEAQPVLSSSGIQGRQVVYSVGMQPTIDIPTRITRKQCKVRALRRAVAIVDVRKTENIEAGRCIQVGSEDGLYLVGRKLTPTHNSELISYLAPAWFLGKYPHKKIIMASHTADLAVNFGRRVRNLVGSAAYKEVFTDVQLQADSKSASRWGTNHQGEYFAIGVGGALAGRGADLFIIDDPHSEQDAKLGRADVFKPAWEWFQSGPIQRLMPGGAIIVVMTRWSKLDLTGEIVNQMIKNDEVDEWEVVEFPAILENSQGVEVPLWPEFWSIEELHAKRAALDVRYWNAQYLQNPTSEEGALIKREWWSRWTKDNPPDCEFIIMSLDAAQEKNTRADYNALTTWGVFFNEEMDNYNIILLNSIKERLEFPELKDLCLREYKDWEPDAFIIEKKSNGAALYQEFRRMGIPLGEFTPGKGQDKIARVNSVSDLFRSGIVWAPEKRWAEEVIEECNDFPSGSNDDLVDSTTMALMRFRQGGFIRLPSDEEEEIPSFRSSKRKALYAI
jgi:predicted phage terminase large subunit-like protein